MPYISGENNKRKEMDKIVRKIGKLDILGNKVTDMSKCNKIVELILKKCKINGDLNYILFAVCRRFVKPSYNNYRTYMSKLSITYHTEGNLRIILIALAQRLDKEKIPDLYAELDCCNREIYRKIVSKYEEEAIKRNGDVV